MRYRRLMFNAFTMLPGVAALPPIRARLAHRDCGTGGTNSARYCYSIWLRHLVMAARHGLPTDAKAVTELGPGDSIGVGLAALLCGAECYTALDVVRHANVEMNLRVLDELVALFSRREDIPGNDALPKAQPRLESYRFPAEVLDARRMARALEPGRVARIRRAIVSEAATEAGGDGMIRYRAPWTDPALLPAASQDLIFSQAVLEHVDALEDTYGAMRRWLKPQGFVSHQIDFKSHGTAPSWDGHWRCGELHWKLLRGRDRWSINRQPCSTHLRLLEAAGFRIVGTHYVKSAPTCERAALAAQFRDMPEADRSISGAFVLATPPCGRSKGFSGIPVAKPAHVA